MDSDWEANYQVTIIIESILQNDAWMIKVVWFYGKKAHPNRELLNNNLEHTQHIVIREMNMRNIIRQHPHKHARTQAHIEMIEKSETEGKKIRRKKWGRFCDSLINQFDMLHTCLRTVYKWNSFPALKAAAVAAISSIKRSSSSKSSKKRSQIPNKNIFIVLNQNECRIATDMGYSFNTYWPFSIIFAFFLFNFLPFCIFELSLIQKWIFRFYLALPHSIGIYLHYRYEMGEENEEKKDFAYIYRHRRKFQETFRLLSQQLDNGVFHLIHSYFGVKAIYWRIQHNGELDGNKMNGEMNKEVARERERDRKRERQVEEVGEGVKKICRRNKNWTNQNCCLFKNDVNQFCDGLILSPFVVYIKENILPRHTHTHIYMIR